MNFVYIQSIAIFVSLVVTGEALALLAGVLIFKKPSIKWANAVNISLVLFDLLLGGYLLQYYFGLTINHDGLGILMAAMVLIATHSFRASQTLRKVKNPYCFNRALGIVNWIKLAGLMFLFLFTVQV